MPTLPDLPVWFWLCVGVTIAWAIAVLFMAGARRADKRLERRRTRQHALANGQTWLSLVPPRRRIPPPERAEIRDLADRMIADVERRVRHEFGGERLPS